MSKIQNKESKTNEAINSAIHIPVVSGIKRTERGWAGHFICAERCLFRRNTLLEYKKIKIVVSTVGLLVIDEKVTTVGSGRYYETMAFHTDNKDKRWNDIDVQKQVNFESEWAIDEIDAEDKANDMHECVVAEISKKMQEDYYR
jgi:hypothetical protein